VAGVEELVDLDGPVGRCSSTTAVDAARTLATSRDRAAALRRVVSREGIFDDGSSVRWETEFDLPARQSMLSVVITFVFDEVSRTFRRGVASIHETPFPAPGSELERMAVANALPQRRVRAVWRQTLAGRRYLPDHIPDVADVLVFLRTEARIPGTLRSFEALTPRRGQSSWLVIGSEGRRVVTWRRVDDSWVFATR
jgi:hypothetical protein